MLPELLNILAVQRVLDFNVDALGKLFELCDVSLWRYLLAASSAERLKHGNSVPVTPEIIDGAVI